MNDLLLVGAHPAEIPPRDEPYFLCPLSFFDSDICLMSLVPMDQDQYGSLIKLSLLCFSVVAQELSFSQTEFEIPAALYPCLACSLVHM